MTKIDVYTTTTELIKLRMYASDIRKLFGLPKRQGSITGASLVGNAVEIEFVKKSGRCREKKFI